MASNNWYVADFETTAYSFYQEHGYTKVWLWSIANSNEEIEDYGEDIESFISWCKKHPKSTIYFHNLKFDGSFILNYLMNNDYEYKEELKVKDNKGYSCLIGEEGQYYQITINFESNKNIIIQDSLKIIPLSVRDIAKAFNLPLSKGRINYNDYTIDKEKLDYVFKDVLIVAKALKFFKNIGLNKMTIGGNAYTQFTKECKIAKQLFPILDDDFMDNYRKAYRGGRTQVNPKYAGKVLHNVYRYDINSMYPYVQGYKELPYGNPIKIKEMGKYKFELYNINIAFKLKKGHLPTLLKTGSLFLNESSYYENSDGVINIHISNIDLELMYRHYDIEYIEMVEGYGFKTSDIIFRKFVDKYYNLKANSVGGLRMVYKLILNNLYGKFGSKRRGRHKIPQLEDGVLTYTLSDEHDMRKYYLPVAIAITSYAHKLIDDAIIICGNDFVYCDTDSVHTLRPLPSDMVNNKEIGKFKLEGIENTSKYLRQKCYAYKEYKDDEETYTITCAGMSESLKIWLIDNYGDKLFDIFNLGLKLDSNTEGLTETDMKLRPLQVKGGVVLAPVQFTLKGGVI